VSSYLIPDRLTAQPCHDFLEIVLLGLLEDVSSTVRQKLRLHQAETSAHFREHTQQCINATIAGR
jgi:hypothetical protein